MRLDKVLSNAGLGSRTEVSLIIRAGRVTVDGRVMTQPGAPVDPESAAVCLDGSVFTVSAYYYYMVNKPVGVITATEDAALPTALSLLPPALQRQRLFPVGRLDRDTEGLLFLTSDGAWAHRVTAPGALVSKVYRARLDVPVTAQDIQAFSDGLTLRSGERFAPALLSAANGDPALADVTLTEGRYHQVKRMFAARNLSVLSLKRIRIGPVSLDPALSPGAWRPLTGKEVSFFF